MDTPKSMSASRSSSRSKRSTTNLSDLRLAPLSTRYAEPRKRHSGVQSPRSPQEDSLDPVFTRSHSSYLQGKSAPTTPGILSRNSSRRHLGGGLSRRGSLYDNDLPDAVPYEYAGVVRDEAGGVRVDVGSGQIPKAKSEAALLVQRSKLAGKGRPMQRRTQFVESTRVPSSSTTPRAKPTTVKTAEDDWLTRTGAAASAMLQESKGQSWLSSRESSTALTHLQDTTDEEDDEGYEEMAALSSSTSKLRLDASAPLSPVSTRASRWGSRYGSRTGSRRTSRRGSFTGSRTPLAPPGEQDAVDGYFEEDPLAVPMEPDFVDPDEEHESQDEAAVARLADNRSFGLGTIVDKLMNFHLFKVEEKEEATDGEGSESEAQATARRERKLRRKREEKDKLVSPPPTNSGRDDEAEGGWADAAWLFSVASKAATG